MLTALGIAIGSALVGVVYAHVLPDDPNPLSRWWFPLLSKWAEAPDRWWKVPRQWVAYPLGYCPKCTSGHLALWSYVYSGGEMKNAIVVACVSILIAPAIIKYYSWATK